MDRLLRVLLLLITGTLLFGSKTYAAPEYDGSIIAPEELLRPNDSMEKFINKTLFKRLQGQRLLAYVSGYITDKNGYAFIYDISSNLTAAQTFEARRGNCVSFSFMMATILRELGFIVYFHSPGTTPAWDTFQDQWIQETHMNLLVKVDGDFYEVDIFSLQNTNRDSVIPLSDEEAFARFYSNQGVQYMLHNQLDAARVNLLRALELDDSYSNNWQNLGIYYRKIKDYPQAASCFEKAIRLSPDNEAICYLLSQTYRRLGYLEQAEHYRQQIREINPTGALFYYASAEDALMDEQPNQALAYIQKAIETAPQCHLFYRAQARAYGMLKDYQKMLDSLQTARDVSSSRALQRIYTQIMEKAIKAIHRESNL